MNASPLIGKTIQFKSCGGSWVEFKILSILNQYPPNDKDGIVVFKVEDDNVFGGRFPLWYTKCKSLIETGQHIDKIERSNLTIEYKVKK